MYKVIRFAIWFVAFMYMMSLSLGMISKPNTIENLIGFALLVAVLAISYKTKCFTSLKLKR